MVYDLIIVGGGLVGRSIAAALRSSSLKIALIDAVKEEKYDPRLIALNHGSICFLQKCGLWPSIESASASIEEVHVSKKGSFGSTRLLAKDIELEALGYVAPAAAINLALAKALENSQGCYQELRPAKVTAIRQHQEGATLTIQEAELSREISASVIIAADGTHSSLRQLLNFETKVVDYEQSALVTTSFLERSHQHKAYERFLDEGALAMLPLKEDEAGRMRVATIWTAATATIERLKQMDEASFVAELQKTFGYRLGRLKGISERHVFPLHFYQVKNPVKDSVVLIGNAAHTLHPVAAQGLNLALYEINELTQLILKNAAAQQPLLQGLAANLIQGRQKTNLLFSHYLTPLFASKFVGTAWLRQLGLVALDLCKPLKNHLSRVLAMEQP